MNTDSIDMKESGIDAKLRGLLDDCRNNLPRVNEELITKAFHFCIDAHGKDLRASGEPFFFHPIEVARIVAREIPLDDVSVAAALLHDVVEDTDFTLKDLKEEFGVAVANIVDGATKITDVFKSHEVTQAASYRKLLLSMVNDVRVILIKFADRLHNMRTLQYLSPERQQRMARETIEIYAPFAHRFGLGNIKWELEDLSFKYLNRKAYDEIKNSLNIKRKEREKYIRKFSRPIEQRLEENNIKFEISGRAKHLYSIYNKVMNRGKSLDEIYDLFAVRIILDTENVNDCFVAYGIASDIYTPVPERFKNYISVPKKNGYQSLHTTVVGPEGKKVEVQIRTRKMHEVAERGVAAHFRYKEDADNSYVEDRELEEWASWVRDIFENAGDEAPEQLYESFKLNLYQDEIYVFTPKGDLQILPKGATPVDFAFDIHSKVGYHCIGAKVNGKIVPLDSKLESGDQVEILTSKNQTPNKDWDRFAITHKAKSQIRKFLKEEKRQKQEEGRELWQRKVKKLKLHINDDELEKIAHSMKFENKTDFYYALATGALDPDVAADMIQERLSNASAKTAATPADATTTFNSFAKLARTEANGINIGNNSAVLYSYARCCNPVPGDDIIGIVTVGSGVKIHRRSCRNIRSMLDTMRPRLVEVEWSSAEKGDFMAAIRITGEDRPAMLNDITSAIVSYNNTNIRSVNIDSFDSIFEGVVTVYVKNTEHLERVFDKLRKIKGVKNVERFEE
jgi:guanosine-3',5'-bis(diphosphate) 3'-pyrophosphohydrolase